MSTPSPQKTASKTPRKAKPASSEARPSYDLTTAFLAARQAVLDGWKAAGVEYHLSADGHTVSWYISGVFAFSGGPLYQRECPDDLLTAKVYHRISITVWNDYIRAIQDAPEMLHGDQARRKKLVDAMAEMVQLRTYAVHEIEALNRLFAGVTDLHPVGNHADYRQWVTYPVAAARTEGQEFFLTSAETTDANRLAVRFGYVVPMHTGPDAMVCYAVENKPEMRIKAGDRIFAPYHAF